MRILHCFVLCLLSLGMLAGQDAKVVILDAKDAALMKSAYEQMKHAEKMYSEIKESTIRKYVPTAVVRTLNHPPNDTLVRADEWQFSSDFKTLLPATPLSHKETWPCVYSGGLTFSN
jgi:hypothetical protein